MGTRMDKYAETPNLKSRTAKNKELYERIKNTDIEKFEISSNATVIGEDVNNIDIEKIKDMLDKKYRDSLPKKTLVDKNVEEIEEEKLVDTKEYDINEILEKAKKNINVDYEKERLKKIHDTQYDILKNLNIEEQNLKPEEETEENIMNLINTITALELKHKESSGNTTALDLLSDLSENDSETIYKTMELDKEKISEQTTYNLDEEDLSIEEKYDDFKELEKDLNSNNLAIKIIIIVFIIIIIIIGFIFFNNQFNLGLF